MNRSLGLALVGLAGLVASVAVAQPAKDSKPVHKAPAGQPAKDMQLPPGMTPEMAAACEAAATPGPQHEILAKGVGVWSGKSTMWMTPGADPVKSDCTSTVTSIMDGKFTRCEMVGDMMGMPFSGLGLYGYDNVAQTYQSSWVSNCGTSMMTGTGEASSDGKTITWTFTTTCPITKKPTAIREVERTTGPDTKTLEMYSTDATSGKEFKTMEILFTRTSAAPISSAK